MPKFVIERNIPGLGGMTPGQAQEMSRKSCGVLREMGPDIQWIQSYMTDDKMFCVYIAPNAEAIREHARRGEFPCNAVSQIRAMADPTTAE